MGFGSAAAQRALLACGGDLRQACELLLSKRSASAAAQLTAMGFESAAAQQAMLDSGGDVSAAVEALVRGVCPPPVMARGPPVALDGYVR